MSSTQDDYPTLDAPQAGRLSPDNPLTEDVQSPYTSARLDLIDFDLTPIATEGGVIRLTPNIGSTSVITWRGHDYAPAAIYSEGWESSIQGSLPRPKVGIRAFTSALEAALQTYRNFEGAVVTRWQTFAEYLDGETTADPEAYFPPQVYKVERIAGKDNEYVEWELSSYTDFQGQKICRRQLVRDNCMFLYRYWNGSAFVAKECPYGEEGVGRYFDRNGNSVAEDLDNCGHKLSDCKLRFQTKTNVAGGGSDWTLHSGSIYKRAVNRKPDYVWEVTSGDVMEKLDEKQAVTGIDFGGQWAWVARYLYVRTTGSVDPDTLAAGTIKTGITNLDLPFFAFKGLGKAKV